MSSLKECSRCGEVKEVLYFSKDKQHTSGYKSACKECAKKDFKKWREANLQEVRVKDRFLYYKRKYKLSDEVAQGLVINRTGECSICGCISPLVVDHCHTTNEVRGFICSACNSMLGYSKDNLQTLQNAINYLRNFYE
jgi:hypothetical protein